MNGRDIGPGAEWNHEYVCACRLYQGEHSLRGLPEEAWLRQACRTPGPFHDRPWATGCPAAAPPRTRRRRTVGFLAACLLVFVLAAGCTCSLRCRPGVRMVDLHGVGDLQARFNADLRRPRLLVIFSPT